MKKILFLLIFVVVYSYSYTIDDAKRLRYETITNESTKEYLHILNRLIAQNNTEAISMMAQTYQEGVFVPKSIDTAISYYIMCANKDDSECIKKANYLLFKNDNYKQILQTAEKYHNKDEIKQYINKIITKEDKSNIISNNTNKIETFAYEKIKDGVISTVNEFSLLFPLFEALGYEFEEFVINTSIDGLFSIQLKKIPKEVDYKLALLLAGDNSTKNSIIKFLKSANETNEGLLKDGYKINKLSLEIGLKMGIKLSIGRVK